MDMSKFQQGDHNLQATVNSIAHDLSNGILNEEGEPASGFDYLKDALDIRYLVTSQKDYIGARVLVAFGGPNIWIDTESKTVEGYWWGTERFAKYSEDSMEIDEALEELWNCS